MVSFTVNLEVMCRVGAQHNETFRRCHEIPRSNTIPVKTNGSKQPGDP